MECVRRRQAEVAQNLHDGKEGDEAEVVQELSLSLPAHKHRQVVGLMREYVTGMTGLAAVAATPTVAIFGSARSTLEHPHYRAARETARLLAEAGFDIITGGGPGIMEAANRGAREAGARSIGCPIHLARAEPANRYVDVAIPFTSFAPRKATLLAAACAFVVFPGGFGTLDELFEAVCAIQTGKMARVPLVLYGSAFWGGLLDWLRETLVQAGTIEAVDPDLLAVVDRPYEAVSLITAAHLLAEGEAEPATEPLSLLRQEQEVEP